VTNDDAVVDAPRSGVEGLARAGAIVVVGFVIARALGYVRGSMLHRAHGSIINRKYMDRWRYLAENGYDPTTDVEIDPDNRLLRWTEQARRTKPRLIELVSGYFAERKEDD